ncbi:MAG: hypothetical protein HUU02_16355 [Bacteroidetes bacterium]|nr:hypothetical protein [Bacteroidota bacterium]
MTRRVSILIFVLLLQLSIRMQAQQRPEWTNTQRNSIGSGYYAGIGSSAVSQDEADTRAFIEFSRTVEVNVKSVFQREVSEEGKEFSDATTISMQLVSDVSLKGITITERFVDTAAHTFFALIRYRTEEYDSLVRWHIEREIVLMKLRNKMEEEKRMEDLRLQKALNKLDEEQQKEQIRTSKEKLTIEEERRLLQEKEEELLRKIYGEFLDAAPPEKVITLRNAEISNEDHSLMLNGGLSPLELKDAFYALRTGPFELGASAHFRGKSVDRQEATLKLQILPRVGEFSRTSVAIGAVQSVAVIADSGYDFKRSRYSLFIAANVTLPKVYYSTFSFYADKKRAGVGVTSFPFFEQFRNHLGFVMEMTSHFDPQFRNEKGDPFVVNAGLRLQASDTFITQLVLMDHKEFCLTLEFQF